MNVIYQYELITIEYFSEDKLLKVEWNGFITSEDYRRIMREMVKLTDQLQIESWIFNLSNSEKLEIGDFKWTTEYLGPILKESTLRKIARVDYRMNQYTTDIKPLIEEAKKQLNLDIEVVFFEEMDAANKWIKNI